MQTSDTAQSTTLSPIVKAIADSAVLIEFDNRIDEVINRSVLALMQALQQTINEHELTGVIELVPSYRSLLVEYDPCVLELSELNERIASALRSSSSQAENTKHWKVPVYYGDEAGCDLDDVARLHEITTEEVIKLHCKADFRAYMLGFAPGWCYLGGLPEQLHTPRLDSPRLKVPAGCISIGGQQGMIGALAMPSGWRLLGQTPIRNYAPDRKPPFLIQAGDQVSFYPITKPEYAQMHAAAEKGDSLIESQTVTATGAAQ